MDNTMCTALVNELLFVQSVNSLENEELTQAIVSIVSYPARKIFLMFEFGLSMIFFMFESATQVSDLSPILHVL